MKRALSVLVVGLLLHLFGGASRAAQAVPDDPGCVRRFPGQICPLADGSGGVCARATCGAPPGRPCLRCVAAPVELQRETPWIPMISFGVVVAIVGFVFWFRLRRAWADAERRQAPK